MLRIGAGRIYDPANGIAGEVRDVCVQDGKIVADVPAHARRIDARGMVVMPGGVDIHAHIAGPKVNAARKLAPEEHRADVLERSAITRSGSGGTVPSTFTTGSRSAMRSRQARTRSSDEELRVESLRQRRGLLDRQVGGLRAFQDPVDVVRGAAQLRCKAKPFLCRKTFRERVDFLDECHRLLPDLQIAE